MTNFSENPMGLMGFEFVEFASPTPNVLEPLFEAMGFTLVARHQSKKVELYRQGDINFIVNNEPNSSAAYFAKQHGPSACGMGFRVRDSHKAYNRALSLGAKKIERTCSIENIPAIKGIGGSALYFIDHSENGKSIYDVKFNYVDNVNQYPIGYGLRLIDHLTHNVYPRRMEYWAKFYEKIFNFREIRYFDISGEHTGLISKAMTSPDGKIRIPINEESNKGGGQIEQFLTEFRGEGIQHVALLTDDLLKTVDNLNDKSIPLMNAPNKFYYEALANRIPNHGQSIAELESRGILLDGQNNNGSPILLLQIFSKPVMGPVFFEFIQRNGYDGFGEGNFKALFISIEQYQNKNGTI